MSDAEPYASSLDHVLAELERLDLLVGGLLEPVDQLQARLDELGERLSARTDASLVEGVPLRLVMLGALFGLSSFDLDVVLSCLAPEVESRCPRPTVELVTGLFRAGARARLEARARFSTSAPLVRHQLVHLGEGLTLDPRITAFLLDDDEIDDRLSDSVTLVAPRAGGFIGPEDLTRRLTELAEKADPDLVVYLHGPPGVGRRTAAESVGAELGCPLLVVDGARLAGLDDDGFRARSRLVDREARLQGALLYWKDIDALFDRPALLDVLLRLLDEHPGPTFLSGEPVWEPGAALRASAFLRIELTAPSYAERVRLWKNEIDGDVEALANGFRLTGEQIRDAAATAHSLARAGHPGDPRPTQADLRAACRLHSNQTMARLAQRIRPRYTWADIVLPPGPLAQLREVEGQVRHRARVHDEWGFGAKLALGKGLSVLLAGPPGTGKTMAADVLAGELGLDLYRIDLSTVVSKYIGETERNLGRIFAEAGTSNAILFFDEADALFGKRTQVREAHDRYANIEVSYLLQRIEEYEGLVVLATNLRRSIDEAFLRRLHFVIEMPRPDEAGRRGIWEGIWPPATPRDPDLDVDRLAHFELSGGNIRNVALAAAYLAASDGGAVAMRHVLAAIRREFQKTGQVLTPELLTELGS